MSRTIRRSLIGALLSLLATIGLVAGTAGTAHAAVPVYSIELEGMIIADNQDNNSVDEVFIKVNGAKVWGPRDVPWNTYQWLNADNLVFYFDANGQAKIEFWDQDPGADDRVGTITILGSAPPANGTYGVELKGNDGHYAVYYTVTRIA